MIDVYAAAGSRTIRLTLAGTMAEFTRDTAPTSLSS